jgi:hypothetical protein
MWLMGGWVSLRLEVAEMGKDLRRAFMAVAAVEGSRLMEVTTHGVEDVDIKEHVRT